MLKYRKNEDDPRRVQDHQSAKRVTKKRQAERAAKAARIKSGRG